MYVIRMQKRFWKYQGRGRYSGGPDKVRKTLEYLARIAVKYDIDANALLGYIREALDKGESEHGVLNIQRREKRKNSAIILLTVGSDVIAQFPISTEIFQREKQLESYMRTIQAKKSHTRKILNPKIEDLRAGMKKICLKYLNQM
jgi:hypothetical protein